MNPNPTDFGSEALQYVARRRERLQYIELSKEQFQKLHECQELWSRLALRLLNSQQLLPPWVVGVTSAIQGEGKTASSIGVAVALAQEGGEKVALVEANLQSPTLAADFGLDAEPGLADYLRGRCSLWETCKQTAVSGLAVVPTGSVGGPVHEMLNGDLRGELRRQLPQLVRLLHEQFPYVLLDLPPVLGNVNTEGMLRAADGVLLVVRAGVTPVEKLKEAGRQLEEGRLLGVIHLGPPPSIPRWLSYLMAE